MPVTLIIIILLRGSCTVPLKNYCTPFTGYRVFSGKSGNTADNGVQDVFISEYTYLGNPSRIMIKPSLPEKKLNKTTRIPPESRRHHWWTSFEVIFD